jgi:hypothetical protein
LSVYVVDPGENKMNISFYDASNQSLIGTVYNVPSFTTASLNWNNLVNNTVYYWYAVADNGKYINQSDTWTFSVGESTNNPPNPPEITGPTKGKVGVEYTYTFTSTDPDDDNLYYYINWGDNTNTGWLGPKMSGETLTLNHAFDKLGTYTIKAKAKDIYGLESNWETLQVSIPRTKTFANTIINFLFERINNLQKIEIEMVINYLSVLLLRKKI